MKISIKKIFLFPLVLIAGILLLSNNAFAEYPYLPYLDYTASFTYLDGSGGGPSQKPYYSLVFSGWNITGGNYMDGSYFGEGVDPVTGAVISINTLYNSSYPNNLQFGSSSGGTGSVLFTIANGGTTYLTAQLENFIITDGLFGTQLNPLWDNTIATLTNITFYDNGSQYIQELQASYQSRGYLNLGMDFSFYSGTNGGGYAFTNDATGSIQGKMAVTPEPLSSVLFIAGGATLAIRRFWKRKYINPE
ncbi:MAG: hypothetical protein C4526_03245 [Nitrospiraceae bacterium]|nr:MAG: hypothetical protein C4526_03245 [Nitrospiraceae bacterium]